MVLVVVLIVITMLTLAGFNFADWMSAEHQATRLVGDQLHARLAAESGIVYLLNLLSKPADPTTQQSSPSDPLADPAAFRGIEVGRDPISGWGTRFSIVAPGVPHTPSDGSAVHFGLENESAKLHLAMLLAWDQRQPGSARTALTSLPGFTPEIADAILDWIDSDQVPREFGAESSYYQGLSEPYEPRNAVPQHLSDLLLVRGVTHRLLFGADLDRNGMVDSREASLDETEPTAAPQVEESSPGGWSTYLTVHSAEANLDRQRHPRINVNTPDLKKLHDQLARELGPNWANFIVAYRQFGPQPVGNAVPGKPENDIDLSLPAKFPIDSLYALIGGNVSAVVKGKPLPVIIESPIKPQTDRFVEQLEQLLDRLTTTSDRTLTGRINFDLAPREVLAAIPGVSSEELETLLAKQTPPGDAAERRHPGWLLTENVFPLARVRELAPYLTAGGDVFRAQIIGYLTPPENIGEMPSRTISPTFRVEVLVDATLPQSRLVFWSELQSLTRGFPLASIDRDTPGPARH
jgi:hypothetical protein